MSEHELDVRVEQLYRRVSAGLQPDRLTTVWVRFEVIADSAAEAMGLVREQVQTGADRGATLREVRVEPSPWDTAPVVPLDPSEVAGEASV